MEYLLFALFILFSIFSALMERRKRRRAQEESKNRQGQSRELEEEEEPGGWPFPMGGDPFELKPPKPRPVPLEEDENIEAERQAREAELLVEKAEKKARDIQHQAQQIKGRRRVNDLIQEKLQSRSPSGRKPRKGRWIFDPQSARDAVVYAEILGPPIANRQEET